MDRETFAVRCHFWGGPWDGTTRDIDVGTWAIPPKGNTEGEKRLREAMESGAKAILGAEYVFPEDIDSEEGYYIVRRMYPPLLGITRWRAMWVAKRFPWENEDREPSDEDYDGPPDEYLLNPK